jgi:hypothetical protein
LPAAPAEPAPVPADGLALGGTASFLFGPAELAVLAGSDGAEDAERSESGTSREAIIRVLASGRPVAWVEDTIRSPDQPRSRIP